MYTLCVGGGGGRESRVCHKTSSQHLINYLPYYDFFKKKSKWRRENSALLFSPITFCHKFNVVCSTWSGVMQGPGGSAECPSPGGPIECPITPTYKEMQVLLIDFVKYLSKKCNIIQQ